MNWTRDEYVLTDEKERIDTFVVHQLLRTTYWAETRTRETIERSIRHSLCFGLFHFGKQVGFARAVTDHATFAWICDVIISPEHRGRGLGKWMMECVITHPLLKDGTQLLRTRDAHALYERFGFSRAECLRRGTGPDLCPPPAS